MDTQVRKRGQRADGVRATDFSITQEEVVVFDEPDGEAASQRDRWRRQESFAEGEEEEEKLEEVSHPTVERCASCVYVDSFLPSTYV